MPNLIYHYRSGSQMWAAFLNGQVSSKDLINEQFNIPIAEEVQSEMKSIGSLLEARFNDTTAGWSNPPTFRAVVEARVDRHNLKSEITAEVLVEGAGAENWQRVNKGTTPHVIIPGTKTPGATYLPMRTYVRHTLPGSGLPKSNAAGGKHRAKPFKRAKEVVQSIRARKFDERIVQSMQGDQEGSFSRRIANATRRAMRRQKR